METGTSNLYDTHPSLKERIDALAALPEGGAPDASAPAVSLLANLSEREVELFTFLNPEFGPKLKPIAWDGIAEAVYVPTWEKLAQIHQAELEGITLGRLPEKTGDLEGWSEKMAETAHKTLTVDLAKTYAMSVVAGATVVKLIKGGWRARVNVGAEIVLEADDKSWEPFACILKLMRGELPAEEWRALCDQLGIAELELSERQG